MLLNPNIATIHGLEEAESVRFLVMELVAGATLAERLERGPLPLLEALGVFRQVAEALKAEYEKKVRGAAKDAEALKAAAEDEAKLIVAKAKEDATALIARRTKSAEDKIAAAERAAVADVRVRAAEAATAAAARLIEANHDAKVDKGLVDTTIARLN